MTLRSIKFTSKPYYYRECFPQGWMSQQRATQRPPSAAPSSALVGRQMIHEPSLWQIKCARWDKTNGSLKKESIETNPAVSYNVSVKHCLAPIIIALCGLVSELVFVSGLSHKNTAGRWAAALLLSFPELSIGAAFNALVPCYSDTRHRSRKATPGGCR